MSKRKTISDGRRDLTQGSLAGNLFHLAVPMMASMGLNSLYNIVDAFWLGKYNDIALNAPGVTLPLTFIVIAFSMGFGNAGTALVAQHTGAGRNRDADIAAGQSIMLLPLIALLLSTPMMIFSTDLLRLMQVPPATLAVSQGYLRIILMGMPFVAFHTAYSSVLRALGDTITMVMVLVVANIINCILDPVLIFGLGPFPEMGAPGAAIASAFSAFIAAAACVVLMRRGRSGLKLKPADFRPRLPIIKQMLRIGLPSGLSMSSNSLGFATFQTMINSLGDTVIGAYTIGFRVTNFLSIPANCMATSAGPVVGQALGAGKPALARRAVVFSTLLIAGVTLIPYILVTFSGDSVARIFIKAPSPALVAETRKYFHLVPISAYFFNVLLVLTSAFMGSGHTRPVFVLSVLRQWLLRIPFAWILGYGLGYGSSGIYGGLVASNLISAAMTFYVFKLGNWQKAVIEPHQVKEDLHETAAIDDT